MKLKVFSILFILFLSFSSYGNQKSGFSIFTSKESHPAVSNVSISEIPDSTLLGCCPVPFALLFEDGIELSLFTANEQNEITIELPEDAENKNIEIILASTTTFAVITPSSLNNYRMYKIWIAESSPYIHTDVIATTTPAVSISFFSGSIPGFESKFIIKENIENRIIFFGGGARFGSLAPNSEYDVIINSVTTSRDITDASGILAVPLPWGMNEIKVSRYVPTPTPTSTFTLTYTPTETNTFTPTFTTTPTFTSTFTKTFTPTDTSTNTPTITNTFTPTFTDTYTSTPTPTVTNTFTLTSTPTSTDTPTDTPTDTFTPTPTNTLRPTPTAITPIPWWWEIYLWWWKSRNW